MTIPHKLLNHEAIKLCILLIIFISSQWVDARSSLCPFTRQFTPYSRCVTCRTCWYDTNSCCLDTHEDVIQESLEVLGGSHWNCRLTILHYQECGKCSPESHLFVTDKFERTGKYLNFTDSYDRNRVMPMAFNREFGVRICKKNCEYIWNQCGNVPIISYTGNEIEGEYNEGSEFIVPPGVSREDFCQDYPTEEEAQELGIRCFSLGFSNLKISFKKLGLFGIVSFIISLFLWS